MITQTVNITSLSSITIQWLTDNMNFLNIIKTFLFDALSIKTNYSSEDLKIIVESWIIQECN